MEKKNHLLDRGVSPTRRGSAEEMVTKLKGAFCCHIFILAYNLEFIKKDLLNSEACITRKDFESTFPFKPTALSVQTPHQC